MTAISANAPSTAGSGVRHPSTFSRTFRFELVKLLSQWRIRAVLVACWIAPVLFVAVVSQQATLPVDTLFGRWMHDTGWAGSLVTLGFAGTWALPLLTCLVAGDCFASEDRIGTWRHLLVAVRSPQRIFAAKAAASALVLVVMVIGLAVSSAAAGAVVVGNHPLVGLDGHELSPGAAAGKVFLAWLCVLAPTLALAGIGLLGSVLFGRSPIGLLLPMVVALAMQLAQFLPLPVAVRLALPGYAFSSWNGLFTEPGQFAPLLIGIAVSLAWAVITAALAYRVFVRRDFTNLHQDGVGRRALTWGVLPIAGLFVATSAILTPTTSFASGIDGQKVERSVATAFGNLYVRQTAQLHRPAVTIAQLRTSAACTRGGGMSAAEGPGNDWRCVVSWHLPGVNAVGQAIYQLELRSDGRYVADGDGPKEVNGYFLVHTDHGDSANPLWQFDGNVDLLSSPTKG